MEGWILDPENRKNTKILQKSYPQAECRRDADSRGPVENLWKTLNGWTITQYPQFIRQLHKSELFVETKTVRFGDGEPRRASVLDFPTIQQKCDVDGFIKSQGRSL